MVDSAVTKITKINGYQSEYTHTLVDMADPKLHSQPADGMLGCKVPLSDTIAPNTLAEVNKKVKLGQKKKRGSYLFCTLTEIKKAQIVQYSSVNGVQATVQRFSSQSIENLSMAH